MFSNTEVANLTTSMFLGCWRKPEKPKETHPDTGEHAKHNTQ